MKQDIQLLDYMAGQALAGYTSRQSLEGLNVAGCCYDQAEAMLAEKARREAVVQESSTTDHSPDSGKVAKLEALNRELAEELEKFTKAVELFIGDGPEVRSSRAILAKAKEVA